MILALIALSCIWPLQFISKLNFHSDLTSIDASWMLALSNAWSQQLVWGKDIIFTYGPLSFLSTRVLINNSVWALFVFDVYFACSFVYIIYKVIGNTFSWKKSLLILLTCFFYKQAMLLSLVFTLQLFVILYLNQYKQEGEYACGFQAIALTVLIFFIKLNLAFISPLIFVLYIFYLKMGKVLSWNASIISILTLILTILFCSLCFPIDIVGYISTGVSLISSYGDAVYIYPQTFLEKIFTGSILAVFILCIFYILKKQKNRPSSEKIICLIFMLILFVEFKQSYVRADIDHLKDFLYCVPATVLIFMYVINARCKYIYWALLLPWALCIVLMIRFQDYYYPIKKVLAFPAYFYSMLHPPDYYEQAENRMLPKNIKQKIGNSTVDIIPWESSLIILNRLNYAPRPIIQSYQAYNGSLDKINANRYLGKNAPEYVLYSINSIDQHYHFFDDTYLKEALYSKYTIIDTFRCCNEYMLLFKRNTSTLPYTFVKIANGEMNHTNIFSVPISKNPLMVKIRMKYSWLGTLQNTFLRAPNSEIRITLTDSSKRVYRTGISILEAGVFMNPYIENKKDAFNFFNKRKEAIQKIKTFQMRLEKTIFWEDIIEYEWYELRFN
jgi:hypothetical protein